MNIKFILSLILIVSVAFSCSDGVVTPPDSSSQSLTKGRIFDVPRVPGVLTDVEIDGLIHGRQEEKVARDVYTVLYSVWGEEFIANIMASEQKHMDALKRMLTKYDVEDPVTDDAVGEFTDPYFTDMFNSLVALGTESSEGAIEAGLIIENSSIAFLQNQITIVTAPNLLNVYKNLLRGSERHLAAFTKHQ